MHAVGLSEMERPKYWGGTFILHNKNCDRDTTGSC